MGRRQKGTRRNVTLTLEPVIWEWLEDRPDNLARQMKLAERIRDALIKQKEAEERQSIT